MITQMFSKRILSSMLVCALSLGTVQGMSFKDAEPALIKLYNHGLAHNPQVSGGVEACYNNRNPSTSISLSQYLARHWNVNNPIPPEVQEISRSIHVITTRFTNALLGPDNDRVLTIDDFLSHCEKWAWPRPGANDPGNLENRAIVECVLEALEEMPDDVRNNLQQVFEQAAPPSSNGYARASDLNSWWIT